ncbi:MFS transporter [Solicola gregarius]|uniref:MFS transporter n=1 Tax=Solicola gregarius TaxID=2908642 RepID=A0AA46YJD8_9ACTN|nr:MFS transporter [Solicola gregarius]UYM03356.1 MFS transporter [Solicola gregarius]
MTTHTPRPQEAKAQHRLLLPAVFLSLATVISAVTSLNVALPDLANDTGATQTQVSWVVDAYALVFAALLLIAGALGDRYGRRLALISGLVLFGAGSLAAMFASDVEVVIALRVVLGVGAALVMPATLSTITTVLDAERRQQAVAIWAGIAGASAVLGLLAAGTLLEWLSWESVFGLNVALAVVASVLVLRAVPESAERPDGRLDIVGGVLFAVAIGAVVYSIIEAPHEGWGSTETVSGLAIGVALLAVTIGWELRHPHPLLDPRLFAHRTFAASSLTITMQFLAFFGFMFLLMQYLQFVGDLSPLAAAASMLPFAVGMMGSARGSVKIIAHLGRARTVIVGLTILTGALFALSRLDSDVNYWLLFTALPFLGIGMGLSMTPSTSMLTEELPREQQGVASAVNDLSRELGGALGIALMGSILTDTLNDRIGTGGGMGEAAHLPGPMLAVAMDAFADGFSNALIVAAWIIAATLAIVVVLTRGGRSSHTDHDADRNAGAEVG